MSGKARGKAECRLKNKPGICPSPPEVLAASPAGPLPNGTNCIIQCRSDSDCRGADKCCNNGCAFVCYSIYYAEGQTEQSQSHSQSQSSSSVLPDSNRHRPDSGYYYNFSQPTQQQPNLYYETVNNNQQRQQQHFENNYNNLDSDLYGSDDQVEDDQIELWNPEQNSYDGKQEQNHTSLSPYLEVNLEVKAGDDAVLNCHVIKEQMTPNSNVNVTPSVVWSRNGQQISVNIEVGRFTILSNGSLIIRNTNTGDHGLYACMGTVDDSVGYHEQTGYIRLLVKGVWWSLFFSLHIYSYLYIHKQN